MDYLLQLSPVHSTPVRKARTKSEYRSLSRETARTDQWPQRSWLWITRRPLPHQQRRAPEVITLSFSVFRLRGTELMTTQSSAAEDVWLDVFWVAVRRDGRLLVPNLNINGSCPPSSALFSMTIRFFSLLSLPPRRADYYYECDGRPPMAERTQREAGDGGGGATPRHAISILPLILAAGLGVSSAAAQRWRLHSGNRQREHLVWFLQRFWRAIIFLLTDQWARSLNVNASGADWAISWLKLQW